MNRQSALVCGQDAGPWTMTDSKDTGEMIDCSRSVGALEKGPEVGYLAINVERGTSITGSRLLCQRCVAN